jgi:hypothetical protein
MLPWRDRHHPRVSGRKGVLPPGVRRPRLYLLDHYSSPSSVPIARSTALLAASSVSQARAQAPQRGRFIKAMRNGRVSPQTAPAPVKRPRTVTGASIAYERSAMTVPIEDYALIGDCKTASALLPMICWLWVTKNRSPAQGAVGVLSGDSAGAPANFSMRGFSGPQVNVLYNGIWAGPTDITSRWMDTGRQRR